MLLLTAKMKSVLCFAVLMGSVLAALAVPEAPTGLSSKPLPNRLGLHLNEYRLFWKAPGALSWQVLVASSQEKLQVGVGDLWDSRLRPEPFGDPGVRYLGKSLPDGATAYWKVRGFDQSNNPGAWSEVEQILVSGTEETQKRVSLPGGVEGPLEYIRGRMGKAARMGKESMVWSEDYAALRSTRGTTILAWIKPEQVGDAWQCIYRKEDGDHRRLLAIGNEGDFWGVWCGFNIAGKYVEFGAPYERERLKDGQWHHIAVTFDQKYLRLYVDGKKIGEKEQPGALGGNGSARAYMGSFGSREHFEGGIDEVEVYTEALTDKQIAGLFSGNVEGSIPVPVGHWKFENSVRNEVTAVKEIVRNRVALVGGTLISRMDKYGYLENALTVHWPQHDISFRNLGWPADDVFGTARSEFGSAHNTRSWQPPKGQSGYGFAKLKSQLAEVQPSAIIVGYGGEAAFADTEEKMKQFEEGYRGLVAELEDTGSEIILLTPTLHVA